LRTVKTLIAALMTVAILVTAASCMGGTANIGADSITEENVPVISLMSYKKGEENVVDPSKEEPYSMPLCFIKGEEYIPYSTLENLLQLFYSTISYGNKTNEYLDKDGIVSFELKNEKGKYAIEIDTNKKTITTKGAMSDLDNEYTEKMPDLYEARFTIEKSSNKDLTRTISYDGYSFKSFTKNGKTYLPLALLDLLVTENQGMQVFYNYTGVYVYNSSLDAEDALDKQKFIYNGKETTVFEQMSEKASGKAMPEYLIKYNYDYLMFFMNNYYGLKYALEIKDMKSYLSQFGYFDGLLSDDGAVRATALKKLILRLDDGHTEFLRDAKAWGEDSTDAKIPQSMASDRETLSNSLKLARRDVFKSAGIDEKQPLYSTDKKVAFITFDEFNEAPSLFDQNGNPLSDEELASSDTYVYFKRALQSVKAQGTADTVIIDFSVNAGGNSLILGKMLALISKDNVGKYYFYDTTTETLSSMTLSVDTNHDGVYDEKDVFGNDFSFYILTSPVAFSCGTAFPFYCSLTKTASVIGSNPGGGECVISKVTLPNGQSFTYSTQTRVSWIDDSGNLYFDEEGSTVEKAIPYGLYYNVDALQIAINTPGEE